MTNAAHKFWFVIIPSLTGVSSAGILIMAALFSKNILPVGSVGYIATAAIALVSFGIIIWQVAVGGPIQNDTGPSKP